MFLANHQKICQYYSIVGPGTLAPVDWSSCYDSDLLVWQHCLQVCLADLTLSSSASSTRVSSFYCLLAGVAVRSRHFPRGNIASCTCESSQGLCTPVGSALQPGKTPSPAQAAHGHVCQQALIEHNHWCPHCLSRALQSARQPCAGHAYLRHSFAAQTRQYHAVLNSQATTAADAPSLASLQGLLHVYKQSLDHLGAEAVQQLRHTLAPSDEEELHEDDTGKQRVHSQNVTTALRPLPCPTHLSTVLILARLSSSDAPVQTLLAKGFAFTLHRRTLCASAVRRLHAVLS